MLCTLPVDENVKRPYLVVDGTPVSAGFVASVAGAAGTVAAGAVASAAGVVAAGVAAAGAAGAVAAGIVVAGAAAPGTPLSFGAGLAAGLDPERESRIPLPFVVWPAGI